MPFENAPEAMKATGLRESNAAVQRFAAAQNNVTPPSSQSAMARPAQPAQAAPEKAVTDEVKAKPQDVIKSPKLELQVPEEVPDVKPLMSVVNSLAVLWGVALLLGLGAWRQSRRWQLEKIPN